MHVVIIGGGPAGLYFGILIKQQDPANEVTILERDGPNDTFGWGIVFSDQTFSYLKASDELSFERITGACETWNEVVVVHRDQEVRIGGNRFSGIARLRFLKILHERCRELGVELRFHTNFGDDAPLPAADLVVGADGANSSIRRRLAAEFGPRV